MDEDERRQKKPPKSNYLPEDHIKVADFRKDDKIQRVA